MLAVYTSSQNHDRTALSRVAQAVEDSFRKFAEGAEVTGIPALVALIDRRAVEAALGWLGIEGTLNVAVDASNWRDQLLRSKSGAIVRCVENALLALHDKVWDGVVYFNQSALGVEMKAPPPWNPDKKVPAEWADEDDVLATAWMQREGIMVSKDIVGQGCESRRFYYALPQPFRPTNPKHSSLCWIAAIVAALKIESGQVSTTVSR